jgi:hypothetical protein
LRFEISMRLYSSTLDWMLYVLRLRGDRTLLYIHPFDIPYRGVSVSTLRFCSRSDGEMVLSAGSLYTLDKTDAYLFGR